MTERFTRLLKWLKKHDYNGWQVFYCRNWTGDPTATVYDQDGIEVEMCNYYQYIEVLGLTKEEQDALCEWGECLVL